MTGPADIDDLEGVEDELDALLTPEPPDDEVDPLDELLAESMATVKDQLEAKLARERLKRGGNTAAQQAEDAERIRRWELANEWQAVANVALFERHRCNCGRQQTIFRQLMQRQQHRYLRDSTRWQAVEAINAELPKEVVVQKWATPMCTECSPQSGFVFEHVTEWTGG